MKSIGEIMKELGFNAEAPAETQKAFIRHLIKEANANSLEIQSNIETKPDVTPVQLSFDLDPDQKVS